jgi:hypothetical protein
MVSELQFVAIAAFLTWGLVSSLCGLLKPDPDEASRLVWRGGNTIQPAGAAGGESITG